MDRLRTGIIFVVLPLLAIFVFYEILVNSETQVVEESPPRVTDIKDDSKEEEQESVRFIFIGDTGTGNENQYAVAAAINNYCEIKDDCRAVFILGDVVYPDGVVGINDIAFIEKFESPYKNIDLPFYILYGNHDYRGCTQCYLDYAQSSEKWQIPNPYYQKSFGTELVNIFALDTQSFDDAQSQWLRDNLSDQEPVWEITLGHFPIESYEASKYGEDWNGREELKEAICEDVDLYISGHAHIMEDVGKIDDCNFIQLTSGAGGAYIRDVHEPFEGDFYHTGYGFLSIEFKEDESTYEFINTDNDVLYSKTIETSKETND